MTLPTSPEVLRWKKGSKKRNAARAAAERRGVCTTCLGKGGWWVRKLDAKTEWRSCTNPGCGSSSYPPGSSPAA